MLTDSRPGCAKSPAPTTRPSGAPFDIDFNITSARDVTIPRMKSA